MTVIMLYSDYLIWIGNAYSARSSNPYLWCRAIMANSKIKLYKAVCKIGLRIAFRWLK